MEPSPRKEKTFTTQAEVAQAHALYIQNMMPLMIANQLNHQRKIDAPGLPEVTAKTINNLAFKNRWNIERRAYMERQSETIATALEQLKESASTEMIVIIKDLHNSFATQLEQINSIIPKTARDVYDLCKATETVQKRLFHFHALRDKPLPNAPIPASSINDGEEFLGGGEASESAA